MTREDKTKSADYLRGRIDGLEAAIDSLFSQLPIPALRALKHEFELRIASIVDARDAYPIHMDWDAWERSNGPKVRPPSITLHADGFLASIEPWAHSIDGRIWEMEDDDGFSILAATSRAFDQDKELQNFLEDEARQQ